MSIHILHGSVQMNHKILPVEVKYGSFPSEEGVRVGEDTFEFAKGKAYPYDGPDTFGGLQKRTLNGQTTIDKTVLISIGSDAVKYWAEGRCDYRTMTIQIRPRNPGHLVRVSWYVRRMVYDYSKEDPTVLRDGARAGGSQSAGSGPQAGRKGVADLVGYNCILAA